MSDEQLKKIFSNNLNYYLNINKKTQADLYKYIGVSSATASNWCTGQKMPRIDKIQSIANWLGIEKSDLLDEKTDLSDNTYYINKDTRDIAQEIFENKELRLLFDAARDSQPEDLQTVHQMLLALKRKERGNED